ncbi:Thiamine pyrophosphate enzyme, C-terminal TPP binding domain [Methylobacterium sp. 174MFSha1.1]|uniref:thiamine pyrophosphate-dependent enzyme n=1 Tax=Methylobacterium sp. 174MFSha1.1 TaxID=1502749 RepID=UPI0008ED5E13|nr:thiamine pyrophosphate-dependent enzyme [Methylobacterium sp. 174MFSha1.1]SFU49793.1 Thiamine pyrophosphate enzyme, C-terminal TPP binding domain [Methylobacterium sp. 174MFSha1.1]
MSDTSKSDDSGTLDRRRAVKVLLAERRDLLVVTGLGSPSYDVFDAGDHDGNFYLWGAMGGAALVGLGLALAQPARPVAVVTGDGEQIMGAGGLMTVAVAAPGNLTIVVLDNGHYGETGMQRSHAGLGVRLDRVAQASGIEDAVEIADEAGLAAYRPKLLATSGGPRFLRVRIASGHVERALPPRDGVYLKHRMRGHLGFTVS